MEDCSVAPDVVGVLRKLAPGDVANKPANITREFAKARLSNRQRGLRQVERGNVGIALIEEVIDKRRGASTDVDDAGTDCHTSLMDELNRLTRVLLEPTNAGSGLRCVDVFKKATLISKATIPRQGSPTLNGRSLPGGTPSSAIASNMATVT